MFELFYCYCPQPGLEHCSPSSSCPDNAVTTRSLLRIVRVRLHVVKRVARHRGLTNDATAINDSSDAVSTTDPFIRQSCAVFSSTSEN